MEVDNKIQEDQLYERYIIVSNPANCRLALYNTTVFSCGS